MRVLCDENIVGLETFEGLCELSTASGRQIDAELCKDVDVLWVRSVTPVTSELLDGSRVRAVGTATAGVEHVDQEWLAARGIRFFAAPGANANAVVEYVLAALAALGTPWEQLAGGATLGIVGYGHVGRSLHAVAAALGWNTRVCDPWIAADPELRELAQVSFCTPEEVLASEVITLHCELTDREPWPSRHLLAQRELAQLREGQWLINAARGEAIDNNALLARLQALEPPACVLDVWEMEPGVDVRLAECAAVRIATPHIAGYSWDAKWQATQMLARQTFPTDSLPADPAPPKATPLRIEPLCPGESESRFAHSLLQQRFPILDDDAAFRQSLTFAQREDRAKAFDELRRDYPQRRELRGSHLAGVQVPERGGASVEDVFAEAERKVIRALGVEV